MLSTSMYTLLKTTKSTSVSCIVYLFQVLCEYEEMNIYHQHSNMKNLNLVLA